LSENLVAPEIEPGPSGSVTRNSDYYTTKAVYIPLGIIILRLSKCYRLATALFDV
jgi:hypothetical protein